MVFTLESNYISSPEEVWQRNVWYKILRGNHVAKGML